MGPGAGIEASRSNTILPGAEPSRKNSVPPLHPASGNVSICFAPNVLTSLSVQVHVNCQFNVSTCQCNFNVNDHTIIGKLLFSPFCRLAYVMKFIEVFRPMTRCQMFRRKAIEHWPEADEIRYRIEASQTYNLHGIQ